MRKYKLTIHYALIQASFYMSFCGIMIYTNSYLRMLGVSASAVGALIAFAYLAGAIVQQWAAPMVDAGRVSLKTLSLLHTLIPVAVLLPLRLFPVTPGMAIVAFFITGTLLVAAQSLLNAISMAYMENGHAVSFGIGRGSGSIGFALTSLALGHLFQQGGGHCLIDVLLGAQILCSVLLFCLPPGMERTGEVEKNAGTLAFFRKYPQFIALVIGLTLIYMTHSIINTYMLNIVESVGGSAADQGLTVSLSAMAEMVTMFTYDRLRRLFSDERMMCVSVVAFTIKAAILLFAHSVGVIHFSQLWQCLSFGLITPAFAYFAARHVEKKDLIQGQAMTLISAIFGGMAGNFLGGVLIDFIGMGLTLKVMTAVSLAGTIICLHGIFRVEKSSLSQVEEV